MPTDETPQTTQTAATDVELLSFRIGENEYSVDIMAVREIRGWTRATSLPHAPAYVRGVINLRGAVLPVIDLALRLGLEGDDIDVDRSKIVEGFQAALSGQAPDLTERDMADALARAHDLAATRVLDAKLGEDADFRVLYERNKARSAAFHERFASQPGAVTLERGAQYRPLATGVGDPAGDDATVVVTFQGALLDGRVFTEGQEVEVRISELNPGSRELLALMRPGDWWQLAIPPKLAYGGLGRPGMGIGPSETIIGDVRLLEVR